MSRTPDKETLQATLRRAAEGDEHAWSVIVFTYSRRVFGLIRAQCGDADLAEEITQSTFCTIVSKNFIRLLDTGRATRYPITSKP